MPSDDSITVIIPALNEERRLEGTVRTVMRSLKKCFQRFEIIVFNDGSTDRTGEIADALARTHPELTVVHHPKPLCLGGIYKKGAERARMTYLMRVNGKNDLTEENFDKIFVMRKDADLVIPYAVNINERSLFRKSVSKLFTYLMNALFGLRLHYYNHFVLCRTEAVRRVNFHTNSYAFQAEILVKLIKSGYRYKEVPVVDTYEPGIVTKAFSPYNVLMVAVFFLTMIRDIYFARDYLKK